jgi:hypothetical protein
VNSQFEEVEALLPDFQYVDSDNDRIVLTVGFTATFYFWNGHTASTREALVKCFEAFEVMFGEHLSWQRDAEKGSWVKLSEKKSVPFRKYVTSLDADDCIQCYFTSGDDRAAAGEYAVSCLTARGWMERTCSCFQFRVPRPLIFEGEDREKLLSLILFCHEQLTPFHANAGLNAVTPYQETAWEAEKFDVATRYLALYIDSFIIDKIQSSRTIKGVNWLTFISNTLSECLGGPASFVNYCRRRGIEPIVLGSGFMIRAGEYPRLCPVGVAAPEEYVTANAALRPLRNGNFGSMGTGSINGELRFDRCTSDLWMRRFDVLGTWPPKTLIGLPRVPLGAAPRKKIKLTTGETCSIHGRYREFGFITPAEFGGDADIAPMVVLLPGDVAPYLLKLGSHGEFRGSDAIKWELIAEL